MKAKVKFSIITVTYNDLNALKKTVKSISTQIYTNFDHIIIDGASNDGTLEYIRSLSFKNLKYISESDTGIYDAMNKGIHLAKGEYIIFLNAGDNFYSDTTLKKIVDEINLLENKPKIIYGPAAVYSEDENFLTTLNPLKLNKRNLNRYATRTVCHQAMFVHKNSIKMYSDKFRLKGELNWYYDLLDIIKDSDIYQSQTIICDYYLGGTGDKHFIENYIERIIVTKEHNNSLKFIGLIPFFVIPLVFKFKRIIFGR